MTDPINSPSSAIVQHSPQVSAISVFGDVASFETAQRMAKALATSTLVPSEYRENPGNCLIAMEIAARVGASILSVTQNLHVIEGRPSWSSPFIIAAINGCGRFSPLRFKLVDLGQKEIGYEYWAGPKGERRKMQGKKTIKDRSCIAWATDRQTGTVLEGPAVTIEMAVREGWYMRNGSKWQTMEDVMLRYRSAAFFGRLYAADILMGLATREEAEDVPERDITPPEPPVIITAPAPAARSAAPVASPPPAPTVPVASPPPASSAPATPAPTAPATTAGASQAAPAPKRGPGRPRKTPAPVPTHVPEMQAATAPASVAPPPAVAQAPAPAATPPATAPVVSFPAPDRKLDPVEVRPGESDDEALARQPQASYAQSPADLDDGDLFQ